MLSHRLTSSDRRGPRGPAAPGGARAESPPGVSLHFSRRDRGAFAGHRCAAVPHAHAAQTPPDALTLRRVPRDDPAPRKPRRRQGPRSQSPDPPGTPAGRLSLREVSARGRHRRGAEGSPVREAGLPGRRRAPGELREKTDRRTPSRRHHPRHACSQGRCVPGREPLGWREAG